MIRVMIVEDNDVVRQALAGVLSQEEDFMIAGNASNGHLAMDQLRKGLSVDVLLADWNMPEMNGLELTRAVKAELPGIKVIILTMHSKEHYRVQALEAGAAAYVLKDLEVEELAKVIREVNGD